VVCHSSGGPVPVVRHSLQPSGIALSPMWLYVGNDIRICHPCSSISWLGIDIWRVRASSYRVRSRKDMSIQDGNLFRLNTPYLKSYEHIAMNCTDRDELDWGIHVDVQQRRGITSMLAFTPVDWHKGVRGLMHSHKWLCDMRWTQRQTGWLIGGHQSTWTE